MRQARVDRPRSTTGNRPGKMGGRVSAKRRPARGPVNDTVTLPIVRATLSMITMHVSTGRGNAPPGLAKKHNGCMPPGQAKKWVLGKPLPAGVVYYSLPRKILVELGPPPPNHKYVRVAQDILLLATGTGMVVDAIDNLNWEFSH